MLPIRQRCCHYGNLLCCNLPIWQLCISWLANTATFSITICHSGNLFLQNLPIWQLCLSNVANPAISFVTTCQPGNPFGLNLANLATLSLKHCQFGNTPYHLAQLPHFPFRIVQLFCQCFGVADDDLAAFSCQFGK